MKLDTLEGGANIAALMTQNRIQFTFIATPIAVAAVKARLLARGPIAKQSLL